MIGNKYLSLSKSLIALAVLLTTASIIYSSRMSRRGVPPSNTVAAPEATPEMTEEAEIRGYKKWTLVNSEPALMDPPTAALCAPAGAGRRDLAVDKANPHRNKFISVYVNDVGEQSMLTERTPKFPVGSVVVKEKLPDRESASPELLTVMIKRGEGFNPASGDWEYLVFNGEGTKIAERGKLQSCQACHLAYQGTDFVTRLYLTDEMRRRLR